MSENELQHSIVHEFSILYSDRIFQKDKRWNDGKLKFYEINNKIEILNDDNILIMSDFFETRNKVDVLRTKLYEGNLFKLHNNKLLIEIVDKLLIYERDVSKSFKGGSNKTESCPAPGISVKIQYENSNTEINRINAIKHMGLKRKAVGLPRIKRELPSSNKPKAPCSMDVSKTSSDTFKKHKSYIKLKIESGITFPKKLTQTSTKEFYSGKTLNPKQTLLDKATVNRRIQRIPSRSSSIFKHLYTAQSALTDSSSSLEGRHSIVVKKEGLKGYKNLENCDVIFDLSDFEEDENFIEMLKKRQQTLIEDQ